MTQLAEQFRLTQKRGTRALSFPKESPRLNAAGLKDGTSGGPLKRASTQADTVRDLYVDAIKASSALGAALAVAQKTDGAGYADLLKSAGVEAEAAQAFITLAAKTQKPTARRAAKSNELYGRV